MGGTIKLKNKPDFKYLQELLKRVKSTQVEVGFPENTGNYPDGTPIVTVAVANEFGTERIPERSFFRTSNEANKGKYKKLSTVLGTKVIEGDLDIEDAVALLGQEAVGDIQEKILTLREPPNAPSTLAKKFPKDNPLIDESFMFKAVTYRVVE